MSSQDLHSTVLWHVTAPYLRRTAGLVWPWAMEDQGRQMRKKFIFHQHWKMIRMLVDTCRYFICRLWTCFFSGKVTLNWETAWPAVTYPLTALPKAVFWAAPFRTSKGNFQTHGPTYAGSISQSGRNSPFAKISQQKSQAKAAKASNILKS